MNTFFKKRGNYLPDTDKIFKNVLIYKDAIV